MNFELILKKNFESYADALRGYPDDFAGHHTAFPRRWKGDRHGNFLPDIEFPGGFNKNAVRTNIADRCDKCTIPGFACRCRQNFIKTLSATASAVHFTQMPVSEI